MEIIFLGTGGGRINLIKQIRGTGGFRINSSIVNIHVDPGPGALLNSIKYKQNPLKLDAIFVSHNHIDHFGDALVLIEAMSQYTLKPRGIIIGSKEAIHGDVNGDRSISKYHQSKAAEVYAALGGEKKTFQTETSSFEMSFIKMKHAEPTTIGFKLFLEGKTIGYVSDSEYVPSFDSDYKNCDFLIVNCLKPTADNYSGHLTSEDLIKLLKKIKPKQCIMTHLGMKMIKEGPAKEAKRIEEESGVKTIAANDGQSFLI